MDLCERPAPLLDGYRNPEIPACYFSRYALSHILATLIYSRSGVSWSLKITPEIKKKYSLKLTALNNLVSWTICLITYDPCFLQNQSSFMDFGIVFCSFIKLQVTFSLLGRFLSWSSFCLLFDCHFNVLLNFKRSGLVFFLKGWEEERSCISLEALIHWTTSSFNFELRHWGSLRHVLNYVHVWVVCCLWAWMNTDQHSDENRQLYDTGVLWNNFLFKCNKIDFNKLFQAQLLKILKWQQLNQLPCYFHMSERHRVCYNFKKCLSVSYFFPGW